MYVGRRTPGNARDAKRMWCPSCFLRKHGGRTLGIQVANLQLVTAVRSIMEKLYSIMDLCPLGIVT